MKRMHLSNVQLNRSAIGIATIATIVLLSMPISAAIASPSGSMRLNRTAKVVNGVTIDLKQSTYANGRANVVLCFSLPQPKGDYLLRDLKITIGDEPVDEFRTQLHAFSYASGKQIDGQTYIDAGPQGIAATDVPVQRCDAVSFEIPIGSESKPVTLSVGTVAKSIPEDATCTDLERELVGKFADYKLECDATQGGFKWAVKSDSQNLRGNSLEQARQIAMRAITDYRSGPWEFTTSLQQAP